MKAIVMYSILLLAALEVSAQESLGDNLEAVRSPTASTSELTGNGRGGSFATDILAQMQAEGGYQSLKSLRLIFRNPEVVSLKDTDVERLSRFRSPAFLLRTSLARTPALMMRRLTRR